MFFVVQTHADTVKNTHTHSVKVHICLHWFFLFFLCNFIAYHPYVRKIKAFVEFIWEFLAKKLKLHQYIVSTSVHSFYFNI